MAAAASEPFRVVYPASVRQQLQEWESRATIGDLRAALAYALKEIDRQLSNGPLAWGEASYRLHRLGLVVGHGFHARMEVRFAVDETRRIVYVSWFKLLAGHPLLPPT
jgi:hypothetical protein